MIAVAALADWGRDVAVILAALALYVAFAMVVGRGLRRASDRQLDAARGRPQGFRVWHGPGRNR